MASQQQQQQQQQQQVQALLSKDGRFQLDKRVETILKAVMVAAAQKQQQLQNPSSAQQQQTVDVVAALEDFENYCDLIHQFCAYHKSLLALKEARGIVDKFPSDSSAVIPSVEEDEAALRHLETVLASLIQPPPQIPPQ